MEKTTLVLGSNTNTYYHSIQNALVQLGIGIIETPKIVTVSNRGVSNQTYFYYRGLNKLDKFKSYGHEKIKVKDILNIINNVVIIGKIEDPLMIILANKAKKNKIPVRYIGI